VALITYFLAFLGCPTDSDQLCCADGDSALVVGGISGALDTLSESAAVSTPRSDEVADSEANGGPTARSDTSENRSWRRGVTKGSDPEADAAHRRAKVKIAHLRPPKAERLPIPKDDVWFKPGDTVVGRVIWVNSLGAKVELLEDTRIVGCEPYHWNLQVLQSVLWVCRLVPILFSVLMSALQQLLLKVFSQGRGLRTLCENVFVFVRLGPSLNLRLDLCNWHEQECSENGNVPWYSAFKTTNGCFHSDLRHLETGH
jgi:hypothetical protein